MIKRIAKFAIRRLGLAEQAHYLRLMRTKRGRRGLRDDRQLAFFMVSTISHNANCIDIGAHTGWVLRDIVKLAPDGHHMAFEPIPKLAAKLATDFPAVEVSGVALSDETGETTFHIADSPQQSGLQRREWLDTGYTAVPVPVRRLDDVVPAGQRVDFLKIDVEGAQVRVLFGARRILAEHHPTIWIEHGTLSAAAYDTTTADLWNLLTEHGYRVWTADGQGPLDLAQMQAANDMPMWTYMAHT
jgi:FkbM family methyltransferase